jgi:aminopeptidase N
MNFVTIVLAEEINLHAHFSYLNGALALPNFFPLLSVYESDSGWWQTTAQPTGDAVYSETAFFDVTLTAPLEWITITSGARIDSVENEDAQTRTSHYVAPLMRDFALMAYPRYATLTETVDGIIVDVHYLPGGLNGARSTLEYATESVRIFNAIFGHYPFSELDVVETYTVAGGIEYPGLIVIQVDSWNANNSYLEFVAVHEVAHQWWYSLVGNDQTRFPWVDESLAQYATLLYYGRTYGANAQNSILSDFEDEWRTYTDEFGDQSLGQPVINYMQHDDEYFHIIYQKGPIFYDTLADSVGENNLIAALSTYFSTYRYRIARTIDLQNSLEQSLNQDLDALFMEWVGQ